MIAVIVFFTVVNRNNSFYIRENYINPAIELGVVKMTLPDKPNSKNQRYVKL